jgi:hypothetical protein
MALQRSQFGQEPDRWKQVQRANLPAHCDRDRRFPLKLRCEQAAVGRSAGQQAMLFFAGARAGVRPETARSSCSGKLKGMRQVAARSAAPLAANRKRNSAVRKLPAPAGCPKSKAGCRAKSPRRSEQVRSEVSTSVAVHPQQCATSNFSPPPARSKGFETRELSNSFTMPPFQAQTFDLRGTAVLTRFDRCEFVKCTLLIDDGTEQLAFTECAFKDCNIDQLESDEGRALYVRNNVFHRPGKTGRIRT